MRVPLKKSLAFFLFVLFSFSMTSVALAEAGSSEKSITGFFRRLFNWGPKTAGETVGMTANTVSNVGEKVVAKTGENTAEVLTGNLAETGNLVADPVVGTLETSGQAVAETVNAPIKAAQEEEQPAQTEESASSSAPAQEQAAS
jgi:hypothetical protein